MRLRGVFNELRDGKEEQSSLAGEKGGSAKDWFWWEYENWRSGEQQFAQDGRTEANREVGKEKFLICDMEERKELQKGKWWKADIFI